MYHQFLLIDGRRLGKRSALDRWVKHPLKQAHVEAYLASECDLDRCMIDTTCLFPLLVI